MLIYLARFAIGGAIMLYTHYGFFREVFSLVFLDVVIEFARRGDCYV
jgi:hypothetical protein